MRLGDVARAEVGLRQYIVDSRLNNVPATFIAVYQQSGANGLLVSAAVRKTMEDLKARFPEGIDYLITGVGTGGHITGVGRVLKATFPALRIFAVEPSASAVISGGQKGPHPIQGIGAGFIPKNLDTSLLDGVIQVEAEAAFTYAVRAAREEGLFLGVSSGASLAAVAKKLPELADGARVLTFTYDTGERYLSVNGLFQE